jgi:hypothetical protein
MAPEDDDIFGDMSQKGDNESERQSLPDTGRNAMTEAHLDIHGLRKTVD